MLKTLTFIAFCLVMFVGTTRAQKESSETKSKESTPQSEKKANQRPVDEASKTIVSEPFDKATVETMKTQCVKLDTEAGIIELEMFPESAPESVRNFLNLTKTGAFDTTTFSRVVPGFVIQGGNLYTGGKMTVELALRSRRNIPDEPSLIKHERGILSMARSEEPKSASTHFFILVSAAGNLDGTFAAFGRVTRGMEVVDAINKMPVEGDKPTKPVRLTRAIVATCPTPTEP